LLMAGVTDKQAAPTSDGITLAPEKEGA
jgi:hypothetical protein